MTVMSRVTAESQGHLLVFHLVDHLCISMLGTHECELNPGAFSLHQLCPLHYVPRDGFSYRAIWDVPEGVSSLSPPSPSLCPALRRPHRPLLPGALPSDRRQKRGLNQRAQSAASP